MHPTESEPWGAEAGQHFPKGLYTHQPGDATFTITNQGINCIYACIGIATQKDQSTMSGSWDDQWTFTISGDGNELAVHTHRRGGISSQMECVFGVFEMLAKRFMKMLQASVYCAFKLQVPNFSEARRGEISKDYLRVKKQKLMVNFKNFKVHNFTFRD